MKTVKLNLPLLIEESHHKAGDVVAVHDDRAAELIKLKHAVPHDGGEVANPDHNPFADVITPLPKDGLVVNAVDGLAPNVEDNPGLKKLAELTDAKTKSAKLKPEDAVKPGGGSAKVEPGTTANELIPATKAE